MTEHELTSLPGYDARYWNAVNPSAGNHGTTQGLVLTVLAVSYGDLQWMQVLDLEDAEDRGEIESIVKSESSRNCIVVVSACSAIGQ